LNGHQFWNLELELEPIAMLMKDIRLLLSARLYFIQYEQMVSSLDKMYFKTKDSIPSFIEGTYSANDFLKQT
jgi:hypothetical protein